MYSFSEMDNIYALGTEAFYLNMLEWDFHRIVSKKGSFKRKKITAKSWTFDYTPIVWTTSG